MLLLLLFLRGGDHFLVPHVQFFGVGKGKNFVSKRVCEKAKTLSRKGGEKAKTVYIVVH